MVRHSRNMAVLAFAGLLFVFGTAAAQIPVWGASFDGTMAGGWDEAVAIQRTPDTCMVVTGFVEAEFGNVKYDEIHTIKYRCADGSVVWEQTWALQPAGGSSQAPNALGVDEAGMIYITGWTYAASTGTDTDLVCLKYQPDGTLEWQAVYNWTNFADVGVALVPDRMGGAYVAGRTRNLFNYDILTMHFGANGDTLWRFRKNSFNGQDWATAITLSPDGWLYTAACCYRAPSNSQDFYTVKFDTTLAAHPTSTDTSGYSWIKVYNGAGANSFDEPAAILADADENVYVTGTTFEGITNYDGTTIKYAADGTQLWANLFDAGRLDEDRVYEMVAGPGGRVYCGGYTYDGNYYNFLFYPVDDVAGVPSVPWFVDRDYLTLDDTVTALSVDGAGNLFVAGAGVEGDRGTSDWLLFKYRPDGSNVWWTDTGNFENEDIPNAMALDDAGDPYVSGVFETWDGSNYNQSWMTLKYSEKDAGALRVELPDDSFRVGARLTPQAWVKSYSAAIIEDVDVTFAVPGEWFRSTVVESLLPYESVLVTFTSKLFEPSDVGVHQVACYTTVTSDADLTNDSCFSQITVIPGWERLADVPQGPKSKMLKDGTALACLGDSLVYALKSSGTCEFYRYKVATDTWTAVESIPYIGREVRKRPKAGSRLAPDTSNNIYAFKGANCFEFWRYDTDSTSLGVWRQQDNIPGGPNGKKVKGGAGLVYVPSRGSFYATKGSNTDEFYYFDVVRDTWLPRRAVIPGVKGYKVKDGSALAYDGDNIIYLIKGNALELYRYKIAQDSWSQMDNIPYSVNDPKRRKFKKGSGLVYDEVNRRLLASKGGKGTEFWEFNIASDTWLELPATDMIPVPTGTKPPYGGADMTIHKGKVYATKGNRSFEFWRYNADLPLNPTQQPGPMAGAAVALERLAFSVAPNPFGSRTQFRYELPQAAHVRLVLYDVMGRVARTVADEWQLPGSHSVALRADGLAAGIYLARLSVSDEVFRVETTGKVTVTR